MISFYFTSHDLAIKSGFICYVTVGSNGSFYIFLLDVSFRPLLYNDSGLHWH